MLPTTAPMQDHAAPGDGNPEHPPRTRYQDVRALTQEKLVAKIPGYLCLVRQ